MAPRGKGKNNTAESVSYDTGNNNGGISFFQILLFFLATTSIAINIGIVYGAIPIQGKILFWKEICLMEAALAVCMNTHKNNAFLF